jgi:hypothetical protein
MPNGRPESDSESYAVPRMPRVAAAFQAAGRGFETRPPLHRNPCNVRGSGLPQLFDQAEKLARRGWWSHSTSLSCGRLIGMNYDQARELQEGGWHWTTMNDGVVRTAWPCLRYVGPNISNADFMESPAKPEDFERCEPHASKEEAERHYYDASLAEVRERAFADWSGCRVCDAPTKKTLENSGMAKAFSLNMDFLCDEHRTREQLAALHPFKADLSLIHS